MLAHVRSDVGKEGKQKKPSSVLRDCSRFHTTCDTEVEIFKVVADSVYASSESRIVSNRLLNFFQTVDDGRVVTSAECVADFDELSR